MFEIEENVPLPPARTTNMYSFRKMSVGSSFEVPKSEHKKLVVAAAQYKKRNPGFNYVTRTIDTSRVRIWRTA